MRLTSYFTLSLTLLLPGECYPQDSPDIRTQAVDRTLNQSRPVEFFSLKDLKPGMHGTGKTVFSGSLVEKFDVEILGVLENAGPKQSIILGRLSGGPLDRTGVLQGMSGSPVYIDGKLVGAVAMAFPYSKEPIAGIRPIAEMVNSRTVPSAARIPVAMTDATLFAALPKRPLAAADNRPADIITPLSLNGFTRATMDVFATQLRSIGFEPQQGITAGRQPTAERKPGEAIEPGSMISVQLLNGDMSVGADGTVTYIDGKKIYAFGHRFLAVGATALPFSKSSVVALLPNLNTSFKIASTGEWMGSITADTSTAVSGELGRRPPMAPLTITVNGARSATYKMEMVRDRFLSPMLLQMALYSALDATERTLGSGSVAITGRVQFEGVREPVLINSIHAGDFNVPLQASLGTVLPIAYALQNSLEELRLASVDLTLNTFGEKKQVAIDQVWSSEREVRPGGQVDLSILLLTEDGREITRKVSYQVPIGAPVGPLYFTVGDAATINVAEQRYIGVSEPRPAAQVIELLNSFRGNTKGYVRVWRSDPAYNVQGRDLHDPPPSIGLILGRAQSTTQALPRTSTIAEMSFEAADSAVSGSKTIQVDVKE